MNIYITALYPTFIRPHADKWQQEGNKVVITPYFDPFAAQSADVLFAEWGDRNAIAIQNFPAKNAMKIVRIHRYEIYTDIWKHFDFNQWDEIIITTRPKAEYLMKKVDVPPRFTVIPCGIKTEEIRLNPQPDSKKIAYMGLFSRKKGLGELEFIANSLPDYQFYLGGRFQEPDLKEKLEKNPRLHFVGWIENKSGFFADMKYVISTSVCESQQLTLLEGMASGCKPLIRDWIGADRIYKQEWVYKDLRGLKQLLEGDYEPEKYRQFVKANYDWHRTHERLTELL